MKNQSGRSMVEMLAVMAITGVLAVTGITAYNYAMTKHQANELVHKLNLAYVEVMTRDSIENWEDLKITGINNIALQGHMYNDAGFVKVENVKKDICNNIITNNPGVDILTPASTPFTKCESLNDMVFDFGKAGTIGLKCESNDDCLTAENQYCSTNTGVCINKTDCTYPTPVWSNEYDKCVTCQMADKTAPLWVDETKECVACDTTIPYYNGSICTTCPDETPYWDSANAKCDTCLNATPTTPIWSATAKDCVDCATASTATPVWNTETKLCEACPAENPNWSGTACVNCPVNSSVTGAANKKITIGTQACYCNNGYYANTAKNGCQTLQARCAAAGSYWTYTSGQCLWNYWDPASYNNSAYCNGKCEALGGMALSSCERNRNLASTSYDTNYRPHCR